jgi:hypothetical protein
MRNALLALLAIAVLACAAHHQDQAPTAEWTKSGGSPEDLVRAKAECKQRAFEETSRIAQEGTATQAAGGVFIRCMEDRGWRLDQRKSTPGAGAPTTHSFGQP